MVKKESGHTSEHVTLTPISDYKIQLTHHRAQLKPQPPYIPLTQGSTKPPSSSSRMKQSASVLRQGSGHTSQRVTLPPISKKIQLTQLKPHPPQTPLIRDGTDFKQRSAPTSFPPLNPTGSKYGRDIHIQSSMTIKDSVITPHPPNILTGKQGSEQTLKNCMDMIQHTIQTQFRPQPPQTPLTKVRSNATQISPRCC